MLQIQNSSSHNPLLLWLSSSVEHLGATPRELAAWGFKWRDFWEEKADETLIFASPSFVLARPYITHELADSPPLTN